MQLPDETLEYHYTSLLNQRAEEWTPAAELRAQHYLTANQLRDLMPRLTQVRSQVAAERDLVHVPPELQPIEAGFIDLPQKTLDEYRRKDETSILGRTLLLATRLREEVDRVVILGSEAQTLAVRALIHALRSAYHNELPPQARLGMPRVYFEGQDFDNDSIQDLIQLIQTRCVDPEIREERWAMIVISRAGELLETSAAYRVLRQEMGQYYGLRSERLRQLVIPITAAASKLRALAKAQGIAENDILTIPDQVGDRFSAFTPAGLLPAAVLGLDVKALLMGAAAMTRKFVEEPAERNPVLQFAAVNYLMSSERAKSHRILAVWSRKLEALGHWYEQLVAESLSKQGKGSNPQCLVMPRDLHTHGQHLQEGARDKLINNLIVKSPGQAPTQVGMADSNQDELNTLARKTYPDLINTSLQCMKQTYGETARPTADLILPSLSEFTMGLVMQLLMLATVVEARLAGVNPYSHSGGEIYRRNFRAGLK